MKIQILLILSLAWLPFNGIWGQRTIELKNPSFEADEPARSKVPSYWINLTDKDDSPPDIQPGGWGVWLPAHDGHTYLGLVVRDNNTCEGLGQHLKDFIKEGSSYTFNLWLNRSNVYESGTLTSNVAVNFNAPTILKIWGYNTKTAQQELLAESEPVGHSKWVRYEFVLTPTLDDFDELDLMAYYAPGYEKMNGNLLIDNCSAIEQIEK